MQDPKTVFILGRQPAIGRAELESLYGATHLTLFGSQAMLSDLKVTPDDFLRLGGIMRLAKPLGELKPGPWPQIARQAMKAFPALLRWLPDGKLKLGISVFGLDVTGQDLLRTGLELKKICKKEGRSVRIVPNNGPELNTAQVIHNQLTGDLGIELLFIKGDTSILVAQTLAVQDIDAYAARDQGRPKRDARVGMLPPKLAQTIVNIAAAPLSPPTDFTVLDPFCGTGVILQESALMGYQVYGTDLEPRMIDYSRANLDWLANTYSNTPVSLELEPGDATSHRWSQSFDTVACETYLGQPFSAWPNPEKLQEVRATCSTIIEKFLKNMHSQIKPGTRLCLAVPCWKSPQNRFHHLPALDRLEEIGYNRVSFEYAQTEELVYYRPDQIVARELIVITRK